MYSSACYKVCLSKCWLGVVYWVSLSFVMRTLRCLLFGKGWYWVGLKVKNSRTLKALCCFLVHLQGLSPWAARTENSGWPLFCRLWRLPTCASKLACLPSSPCVSCKKKIQRNYFVLLDFGAPSGTLALSGAHGKQRVAAVLSSVETSDLRK